MKLMTGFTSIMVAFLAISILFWPSIPDAAEKAGQLELKRGVAKVRRDGKSTIYKEQGKIIPLFVSDVIHTGKSSYAKITLAQGKDSVSLYSNSHFIINSVSRERSRTGLSIGKAVFGIFSRVRQNAFSVATPTATIGVKGTDFVIGAKENQTFLMTLNGSVGLISSAFSDLEVITEANQASSVRRNQPPSPPIQVTPKMKASVLKTDSLASMESIDYGDTALDPITAPGASEIIEESAEIGGGGAATGSIKFDIDYDYGNF